MKKTRLVLICFAAVSAVAYAQGPGSWAPAADETRAGGYTFEKLGGSAAQPVKISLCRDVTCAAKTDFATVTADSYSALAPAGVARPYFLVERNHESRTIAARRLALQGAYNFRDLGGLRTTDGKTVRWGEVFRSDTLTHLTDHDYERLNAIGISLVCDLRSRDERKSDPTEWKDGSPVILEAPVSEDAKGTALDRTQMGRLQTDKLTLEEGYKIFENFYVRMVVDSAPKFGTVLRAIATTDKPSMFHCTGGRDRTGITAALLLHILGVPDQTIANDFVLSTKYLNENPAPMNIPGIQPGTEKARFFAQVIELQPRYIAAIFKGIDEKYGSFDRYRRESLRLSDADVALLKSRLLR
jgi:protein-tyrosine phosphatase